MVIEAKFENGVFKPIGEVKREEGTRVEIHINYEKTTERSASIRDLGLPECGLTVKTSQTA